MVTIANSTDAVSPSVTIQAAVSEYAAVTTPTTSVVAPMWRNRNGTSSRLSAVCTDSRRSAGTTNQTASSTSTTWLSANWKKNTVSGDGVARAAIIGAQAKPGGCA